MNKDERGDDAVNGRHMMPSAGEYHPPSWECVFIRVDHCLILMNREPLRKR